MPFARIIRSLRECSGMKCSGISITLRWPGDKSCCIFITAFWTVLWILSTLISSKFSDLFRFLRTAFYPWTAGPEFVVGIVRYLHLLQVLQPEVNFEQSFMERISKFLYAIGFLRNKWHDDLFQYISVSVITLKCQYLHHKWKFDGLKYRLLEFG